MRQYDGRAIDSDAIKTLRLEARLTQQELATAAGMGIATLSAWERPGGVPSDHLPRISNILRLAEALSGPLGRTVDPGELLRPRQPEPTGVAR